MESIMNMDYDEYRKLLKSREADLLIDDLDDFVEFMNNASVPYDHPVIRLKYWACRDEIARRLS